MDDDELEVDTSNNFPDIYTNKSQSTPPPKVVTLKKKKNYGLATTYVKGVSSHQK